jgi:primary-amine oxidase
VNDTLLLSASGPWSFDGSFRRAWLSWKRNTPGSWVNVVNLFMYLDFTGTDMSQYKILKVRRALFRPNQYQQPTNSQIHL